MTEAQKDTKRAIAAMTEILDGRDPRTQDSTIMVTVEHAVTAILLVMFPDAKIAAGMLNEGLVPGVEARLARYASEIKK
jgi:hypothetical protein